jgi:hypothetical protein
VRLTAKLLKFQRFDNNKFWRLHPEPALKAAFCHFFWLFTQIHGRRLIEFGTVFQIEMNRLSENSSNLRLEQLVL